MKGIIFDFNGTMFLDSHLHEAAWLHMIHDHTKDGLSDQRTRTSSAAAALRAYRETLASMAED